MAFEDEKATYKYLLLRAIAEVNCGSRNGYICLKDGEICAHTFASKEDFYNVDILSIRTQTMIMMSENNGQIYYNLFAPNILAKGILTSTSYTELYFEEDIWRNTDKAALINEKAHIKKIINSPIQ